MCDCLDINDRLDEESHLMFRCVDCQSCTFATDEYYMVTDEVWVAAGMSLKAGAGMLCLVCLPARLGRALHRADFTDAPINEIDAFYSPRLRAALETPPPSMTL